jgi:hypothetical protein
LHAFACLAGLAAYIALATLGCYILTLDAR